MPLLVDEYGRPFAPQITEADLRAARDQGYAASQAQVLSEIMEASASAEGILATEDRGWMLAGTQDGNVPDAVRTRVIQQSRRAGVIDPFCKQIIALYTNFGVGTGVTWKASGDKAAGVLKDFANDPNNQVVMSRQGQRMSSDKLVTDGNLFFALFGERDIKIRWLNTLEMTIASDPEDKWTPRYYKRAWHDGKSEQTRHYRDYRYEGDEPGVLPDGKEVTAGKVESDAPVVYHVTIQTTGQWGNPILTATLPWCKAHRAFMQSRVSIEQALARFAWVGKAKGTQAQITGLGQKLNTTLDTDTGAETNPPPVAGSTLWTNDQVDLKAQKQETGASAAQIDGNMLILMIAVSAGIMPHWLGAGEAFRLATAEAMEPPIARTFGAYRELKHDVYKNIFRYVLEKAGVSEDDRAVDIDSQEVFPEQAAGAVEAIWRLLPHFPAFVDSDAIKQRVLGLMGLQDVEKALEALGGVAEGDGNGKPEKNHVREMVINLFREAQAVKGGTGEEGEVR